MSAVVHSGKSTQSKEKLPVRSADWIIEHPASTSIFLLLLVLTHGLLSWRWQWLSPYKSAQYPPEFSATSVAVSTSLGVTTASSILAGLAGVIIVFTVGSSSPRVRGFRSGAGKSLQRTWVAVVVEPLVAAGCGLVAAVTLTTSGRVAAPFITEAGLALLLHTAFRLVWLLRELVRIVAADDVTVAHVERTRTIDELLGPEP